MPRPNLAELYPRLTAARVATKHEAWLKGDVRQSYKTFAVQPEDVALDIGACVGWASLYLLDRGVSRVVAIEPAPQNYGRLCENLLGTNAKSVHGAVVGAGTSATVDLAVGGAACMHRLASLGRVIRKRPVIAVPAIQWATALSLDAFTLVKVDVEGAEYLYDWTVIPISVREVVVEWHMMKKGEREKFQVAHLQLLSTGFVCTNTPSDRGKNWTTIGHYRRAPA